MAKQAAAQKGFLCQMSAPLMNKMAQENPQPDPFIYVDDSSMNSQDDSQLLAGPKKCKKHQERTSFTQTQHKELEALFSCNMFPDKNLQRKLALKLNLPDSTVKIWFRNRRFKMRKQQQQQQKSLKPPNQILPAKNVSTASTSPHFFPPTVSDFCSSFSPQPLGPFNWVGDSVLTESPTSDVQIQDPQLERLVASVPALYSDAYDIAQIMEMYSFPDEDEIASYSFHSLYQYLSPTRPS
ncbi:arginine-fifty homeobox [Camelus dromedarius]|uniref:arginine-fifty homeobox n=1 Tax=Camelus dromedarius TaxID=9838 RepID=UPI00311A33F9